jgi:gliding motility-associated-like protein
VVCDSGSPALCDTAYVVVSVTGVNDPPTIASDTLRVTTLEDEPVVIDLCAQLGDPEGGDLAVSVLCEPGSGALALSGCVLTYTPSPNFFGADTLCLVVCDSGSPALCDTAVVVITISPINDLPIAVNDNYTVNRGGTLTILSPGVLINDSDVDSDLLTSIKVTDPSHGALTLNDDGSFTYIHDGSKTSSDSFTYKVNDGSADGNTVTVSITILPVNEMPIAVNDINSLDEGQIDVIGNILSNDYDPDGDPLSVISIDGNTNISTGISGDYGTLTCNSLGNYTYTLNNQSELAKSLKDGETLIERFDYSISDGNGGNANAVLEITIHGKNNDTGIVISEGFSPDGDGKGDNFIINGIENYPDNELVVYNRWGTKVYQKKGYNNEWDGRSSVTHAILPVGTYYYILTIKEKNSTYKGYVYLKY